MVVAAVLWVPFHVLFACVTFSKAALAEMALKGFVELIWIGSVLHLCRAKSKDNAITPIEALSRAWRSAPRLFGLNAVLGARILFGFVFVIPGIIWYVRYALTNVLGICKNVGPSECRKLSSKLVGPHFFGIAIVLALFGGLEMLFNELNSAIARQTDEKAVLVTAKFVASLLTALEPLVLFEFFRARTTALLRLEAPPRDH